MNWGGGWSDTPPYCNEKGGTVLNAAILLNGEKPVEVTLERIPEQKVIFDSRDMDVHGEFDMIEPLQATGDPYDPFALQKACLLACGIIPREGHTLGEILERLGSGFVMHFEVTNVPKGSGLGTSPILSAACVKAVFEFMGIAYTEEDLYAHVLAMEQIMSTGGVWREIFSVMWWDAMWAMNRTVCLRWRRYRSNLQALFLVHPAAFIQVAVDQKQEYNC